MQWKHLKEKSCCDECGYQSKTILEFNRYHYTGTDTNTYFYSFLSGHIVWNICLVDGSTDWLNWSATVRLYTQVPASWAVNNNNI